MGKVARVDSKGKKEQGGEDPQEKDEGTVPGVCSRVQSTKTSKPSSLHLKSRL